MLGELFARAWQLPREADPDTCVEAWEAVLTHPGFGALPVPERWSTLAALGTARLERCTRDGRLEDLAGALNCLERALALPAIPAAKRAAVSFNLFRAQEHRYALTDTAEDLLTAARTLWSLVDEPPPGMTSRQICRTLFTFVDDAPDELTPPLRRLRRTVLERLLTDPVDPDRPRYQLTLAAALAGDLGGGPAAHLAQLARAVELAAEGESGLPDGADRRSASTLLAKLRSLHAWAEEHVPREPAPAAPGRIDAFEFIDDVKRLTDRDARLARLRQALADNPYEAGGEGWVFLCASLAEEVLSPRTNGEIDTDEAVAALRAALAVPEAVELGIALELRYNLGIAYARRREGDRAANEAEALAQFEACLAEVTPAHPRYPAVVGSLAQRLLNEANRTDRRGGIGRAIGLCRTALASLPHDAEDSVRADLYGTLAKLLPRQAAGDPARHIEEAIGAAHQALDLLDPVADRLQRGDVHHNLAHLYRERLAEGREANLWRAIEHYRASLTAQPKAEMPVDWAMSQTSLGVAYSMMRGRDVEATQRLAVQAFMAALSVFTLEEHPGHWAQAQFNLGVALGDHEVRAEPRPDSAITHLTSCLQVFTEEASPREWALTQSFLGIMRAQTGVPEQRAAAIEHFRAALRVLTFENSPRDWAVIQVNLSQLEPPEDRTAHENMIKALMERGQGNEAVTACILYLRFLGAQGDWSAAADAGARAAELHEGLYQDALLRQSRHMEQRAVARDVLEIVTAMVRAGRTLDAVLLLERTRARELGETLQQDQDVLRSARDADPAALDAYRAAAERLARLGSAERSLPVAGYGTDDVERLQLQLVRSIAGARKERDAALARLTAAAEPLRPPGVGELSAAAPAHRPLVYLYLFEEAAHLLLVRRDGEGGFDLDTRRVGLREAAADGALGTALQRERLTAVLAAWLRELGADQVTLVACGALAGMPLHAYVHDGRCLLDEFTVSFAPSAAVLARRPSPRPGPPVLAAVGDPTGDLRFASAEAAAVAELFPWSRSAVLRGAAAAAPVLLARDLPGATHVHLACHGVFDPSGPLESAFVLAGGSRMTLRRIMADRAFRGVGLVFASACRTASTDAFLPDEAIGLASGLLQAGAVGVVASLWNVDDLAAMLVATRFYRELARGGDPGAEAEAGDGPGAGTGTGTGTGGGTGGGSRFGTGQALRAAQLWLRDSTAAQLSAWCAELADLVRDDAARVRLREACARLDGMPGAVRVYAEPRFWAAFVHVGA
ncbi:CHAT domain-containing protein [Streptomyces sp. NPDC058662]|uniref:CHAT domain-containing tetratricopeptide repeat protein n=1 Tax=Streptomyces sp. NPDC058662 TaxID=3346583 RepID=UPI00364D48AC